MPTNNLEAAISTSVKFYASLTRNQAKGIDSIGINPVNGEPTYVEPGAVCFVSDALGNSIFLNNRLFGDGAQSGGGGGGGGITEVHLSDLVVVELDGKPLKTLADYFNADGDFITDKLTIFTTATNGAGEEYQVSAVVIDKDGITISGSKVLTEADLPAFKEEVLEEAATTAGNLADTAEKNAKAYADTLVGTVYKVKGSVENYSALACIQNPKAGDVYNVVAGYGTLGQEGYIPPGTNYVWVAVESGSKAPGYWDPLGGTIDLSSYKTAANTTAEINEGVSAAKAYADSLKQDSDNKFTQVDASLLAQGNTIANQGNQISQNTTNIRANADNIKTNTTNITNIVTQLTWQ